MSPSRAPEAEDLTRTATALRIVYSAILPRLSRSDSSHLTKLGYAAPSYNRACVRTHQFMVELAEELGQWWYRLVQDSMKDDPQVRRIVREYQEEAAVELADFINRLPEPQRRIVVLKSAGLSWKQVMKHHHMEGRAYFSVMDDWNAVLRRVWQDRGDLVRRLV